MLNFFHTKSFHCLFCFLPFLSHFCSHLKNPDLTSAEVNEILPLTMNKMKNLPLRNHYSLFFFSCCFSLWLLSFITLLFIVSACNCSLMFWLIDFVSLVLTAALLLKHFVFPSAKEIGNLLYKQTGCWMWFQSNSQPSIQKGSQDMNLSFSLLSFSLMFMAYEGITFYLLDLSVFFLLVIIA